MATRLNFTLWPLWFMAATYLIALTPPVYATLDLTPFATVAAALGTGGIVHAINQARKTPAEVESISVATLDRALKRMEKEIERKDNIINSCNDRIDVLQDQLDRMIKAMGADDDPTG